DRLPAAGAKKAPLLQRSVAALSQKLALARGGALAVEKIVRRDGGVLHADRFRSTASKVPLSTRSVEMESGELCSFASAQDRGPSVGVIADFPLDSSCGCTYADCSRRFHQGYA